MCSPEQQQQQQHDPQNWPRTFAAVDHQDAGNHDGCNKCVRRRRATVPYPFKTRLSASTLVFRHRVDDRVVSDAERHPRCAYTC
jgi:hypothetical protein